MVDISTITPIQRTVKKYGWIPDFPDARDHRRRFVSPATQLPPRVDLRPQMPPVWDQGDLGSCTGNGIAALVAFDRTKQGLVPLWTPSRLFIYYNERVIENSVNEDSGAMIRDGIKSVGRVGVCDEALWPYDPAMFAQAPSDAAYAAAMATRIINPARVIQTTDEMRACLQHGYPFTFGFTVYESFETAEVKRTGIMPVPDVTTEHVLGGHCVACVGYDDVTQLFTIRNSWGPEWGDAGHCYMPYEFLRSADFCDDLWHFDTVTG